MMVEKFLYIISDNIQTDLLNTTKQQNMILVFIYMGGEKTISLHKKCKRP